VLDLGNLDSGRACTDAAFEAGINHLAGETVLCRRRG